MRLSPEPRTDSNQQSGSAGDPQEILGLSRKAGLGCSVVFQFGLWSLLWEGSISSCPHPAPAAPHSFRDRMMSSSRSELSELSAAKETRGLCWVCDSERVTPALHISAPNCSNAARKSAPEPSFPAYNRGSRRAALASAVPMSWQVFPQQGREDTSRAACTTSCAQKRATALHTRGWTVVAVVPQAGQLHQPGPSMMCTR